MRCAEPASFTSVANRDWLRSRVHSCGPSYNCPQPKSTPRDLATSFLNQIALRELQWIHLAVAHALTCSARNLVLVDAVGGACIGAWHIKSGCCCHPPNAC
jgi:hypothetical protein